MKIYSVCLAVILNVFHAVIAHVGDTVTQVVQVHINPIMVVAVDTGTSNKTTQLDQALVMIKEGKLIKAPTKISWTTNVPSVIKVRCVGSLGGLKIRAMGNGSWVSTSDGVLIAADKENKTCGIEYKDVPENLEITLEFSIVEAS